MGGSTVIYGIILFLEYSLFFTAFMKRNNIIEYSTQPFLQVRLRRADQIFVKPKRKRHRKSKHPSCTKHPKLEQSQGNVPPEESSRSQESNLSTEQSLRENHFLCLGPEVNLKPP